MRREYVVASLVAVTALFVALSPTWITREIHADDDEDDVHDLMEKVHHGKKAPWNLTQRAVSGDPVDWATIAASMPRFGAMARALATSRNKDVRDSADGYVEAVKELGAQAAKRDLAKARAAVKAMANSCTDCHYKGGPGGKLD